MVTNPGSASFIQLLFDLFSFIFLPITGGLMMTSIAYNYDLDAVTYRNAEITKADMYASQMSLIKTSMYKAIGQPDYFGVNEKYVPPNSSSFFDI